MRFLSSLAKFSIGIALPTSATTAPDKRQAVVPIHGKTVQPANGSLIAPEERFPFIYHDSNYCHSGYSPIAIYLSKVTPTSSDITASGGLMEGSFLADFGQYLYPNFGLPQMGTPPPSTLTMPSLYDTVNGTTLYLTVVESFRDCPHALLQFGMDTTTLIYYSV